MKQTEEKNNKSKTWNLDVQSWIASTLDSQDELASKAASDLETLYGTRYTYGSTFNTICKYNRTNKNFEKNDVAKLYLFYRAT